MEPKGQFNSEAAVLNKDRYYYRAWQKRFNRAFDAMLSEIWFITEAEAILPENVEKTKKAYTAFLNEMSWRLPKWCFEDLLREKTGKFAYRADKAVPNWYHEFREMLCFMTLVRSGLLKESRIREFGGTEVALGMIARHDSWEDLGKDRTEIYGSLEGKLHELRAKGELTDQELREGRNKAAHIVNGVDFLTRKTPRIDEAGQFVFKPGTDKYIKDPRLGGQLNLYYDQILKSPLTTIGKFLDGIEGMSTRVGVKSFSVEDDRKYTDERRMLFGRRMLDVQAIARFPFLKDTITTLDHMLGILLVELETLNDYAPEKGEDPRYATPMRISHYTHHGAKGFEILPSGWHPLYISMERMWAKADREKDGRVELIIRNAMLPSLTSSFPKLLYPKPAYANKTLPSGSDSGPS